MDDFISSSNTVEKVLLGVGISLAVLVLSAGLISQTLGGPFMMVAKFGVALMGVYALVGLAYALFRSATRKKTVWTTDR